MECHFIDSLVKVFPDAAEIPAATDSGVALAGEVYSLQLAYRVDIRVDEFSAEVDSPLAGRIELRRVGVVPVEFVAHNFDDDVLRRTPGMYPDLLTGLATFRPAPHQWHALWLTVRIPEDCPAGRYEIRVRMHSRSHWIAAGNQDWESETFTLEVLPVRLERAKLVCTEWFHADCVAERYGVGVWSEGHWGWIEKYFRNMSAHGVNMVYVPLFTPPLDTEIGGERPTTQLIGVAAVAPTPAADGRRWRFDFTKFERYCRSALACGLEYLEMSHLFTQWGAKHAPKIVATMADGTEKKLFGWETDANGADYRSFLAEFLPELRDCLEKNGWKNRVYLHVSDEPPADAWEQYADKSRFLHQFFPGFKFMDALSNPVFCEKKLVDIPVPASNHLEQFRDFALPERWVYYCVSQWDKVSNQFMHFSSARNRIMGVLLYVYDIDGFLHWGYNYWFAQFSRGPINPYRTVDARWGFPPGDAFKVYPGVDAPEDSLRHEVFFDALQDLAALRMAERRFGRAAVLEGIEKSVGYRPTMTEYPRSGAWILQFRAALNTSLAAGKWNVDTVRSE